MVSTDGSFGKTLILNKLKFWFKVLAKVFQTLLFSSVSVAYLGIGAWGWQVLINGNSVPQQAVWPSDSGPFLCPPETAVWQH